MRSMWCAVALIFCCSPACADVASSCIGNRSVDPDKKTTLKPGWVVCVYPRVLKGQEPFPVGRFIATPAGFAFGDFRKSMPHPGWASFRGGGLFNAKQAGPYTFSIILKSLETVPYYYQTECSVELQVADKQILTNEQTNFNVRSHGEFERSASGGIELAAGGHPIQFSVSCPIEGAYIHDNADNMYQGDPNLKTVFDRTTVAFTVFGPDDMGAHAPQNNQIIHDVREPGKPTK